MSYCEMCGDPRPSDELYRYDGNNLCYDCLRDEGVAEWYDDAEDESDEDQEIF